MASTFLSLHYHLVFSTKGRVPCIRENWIELTEMLKRAGVEYDPRYLD